MTVEDCEIWLHDQMSSSSSAKMSHHHDDSDQALLGRVLAGIAMQFFNDQLAIC